MSTPELPLTANGPVTLMPDPSAAETSPGELRPATLPNRMLSVTVLATLLPVLLMAALGYFWTTRDADHHLQQRLAAENRYWASLISQRVQTAQTLLNSLANSPSQPSPAATAGVLENVSLVDTANSRMVLGDANNWALWQQASALDAREASATKAPGLRWLHDPQGKAAARVWLGQQMPDGGLWLAELAPSYLWAGLPQAQPDVLHCLTDARNRVIHCPQEALERSGKNEVASLKRSLYWGGDAGGSAWTIQTLAEPPGAVESSSGLIFRSLALIAVVCLVLCVSLAMRNWKRMDQSLKNLTSTALNWSEQDWGARIRFHPADDLRGLAEVLNHLADRTNQKLRAIQVQSAIDREILGGLDTHRVMRLVVDRLQALLPKARVAVVVVEAPSDGENRWTIHRPGRAAQRAVAGTLPVLLSEDDWALTLRAMQNSSASSSSVSASTALLACGLEASNRLPVWASKVLGVPREWLNVMVWVPVRRQGQALAYLALGSRLEMDISEDTQREITDLRDRVAVMLTSAARESALLSRAIHDGLTGLLNRIGLQDAIDDLVSQGQEFTLVLVDLDRFKEVNDTLGHQAGDELLCAVAARLRSCVAPQARISRPGGDEFVLLLPGSANEATAAAMAICAELARPFPLRGVQQQIGGSMGLAAFPQQAQTRGELMRRADLAMYVSKGEGRGRFSWYAEAMDERIAHRAWMTHELRIAVDRAHFILHYQPRVEAGDGHVVSAEALLRWPHAQRGLISPAEFVPTAEDSGLIDRLGAWVLASAFQQMSEWRAAGVPLHRVAVNVSARQLMTPGFAPMVLELMERYQLAPSDIELELTESVFAGDVDAVCLVLDPLRKVGIQLALDDFGTGYSSLSSLYRLPVDVIKIDHSFVRDLGRRPSAEIMARSIVALAKALDKRVVAEGVETFAQRDHLLRLGCDELQGYLYGRPMAPGELVHRISELAQPLVETSRAPERATAKT